MLLQLIEKKKKKVLYFPQEWLMDLFSRFDNDQKYKYSYNILHGSNSKIVRVSKIRVQIRFLLNRSEWQSRERLPVNPGEERWRVSVNLFFVCMCV